MAGATMAETALIPTREVLEVDDIQGLIRRGYSNLRSARFLLLAVADAARARAYLRDLKVTPAAQSPQDVAIHVCFTYPGLVALELPGSALATFPREFKEGMSDPDRSIVLGDVADNDPARWEFGSSTTPPIHAMLMIYARTGEKGDESRLLDEVATQEAAFAGGFELIVEKDSRWLEPDKEHFGFRDGLSMAQAEGFDDGRPDPNGGRRNFKNGEFILGYRNDYGHYTESPLVAPADDPQGLLPAARDRTHRDLGKNGTFLVYRQLAQHVADFWGYMARESREPGDGPVDTAVRLAAKMVGRWPEGGSLVDYPDGPRASSENTFGYWDTDRDGTRCPFGSHIRRTNPRDQLPSDHTQADSIEMTNKHQILRRGRTFGAPLDPDLDIKKMIGKPDDGVPRGLHFICLAGHLHRQFEFMQNAWVKSPNFAALTADADPLVGARCPAPDPNRNDEFTCPADPVRRKYKAMPKFTTLLGGGYFFLPGLAALRYIASDRVAG